MRISATAHFFIGFFIFNIIKQQSVGLSVSQLKPAVDIQDTDTKSVRLYFAALQFLHAIFFKGRSGIGDPDDQQPQDFPADNGNIAGF